MAYNTRTTGKVLFPYVPQGIDFAAMANLSATSYDHRYFVDGQIDVTSRATQGNDKNILVGALGRGGRGVFALDVTNPGSMGQPEQRVVGQHHPRHHHPTKTWATCWARCASAKGNGDKTYALVPNGIDSPNGSATLFVLWSSVYGWRDRWHAHRAGGGCRRR